MGASIRLRRVPRSIDMGPGSKRRSSTGLIAASLTASVCQLSGYGSGTSSAPVVPPVTWNQTVNEMGGPPVNGSPVATAYAWFRAANSKDCNRYQSFFRHPDPNCRGLDPPTQWPPVSNVKCADLWSTPPNDRGSTALGTNHHPRSNRAAISGAFPSAAERTTPG